MARPMRGKATTTTAENRDVSEELSELSDEEAGPATSPKRRRTSRTTAKKTKTAATNGHHEDDDDEDADGYDSFDSGSEKDLDETDDFIAPGGSKVKAKKPRISKASMKSAKGSSSAPKATSTKTKSAAGGSKKKRSGTASRAAKSSAANREELDIEEDNVLFNAIKNPETALQVTVDDWVVEYQTAPGPALTTLINLVIRSCGCNSSVDEAAVLDLDGVVDTLEQVQEEFKQSSVPSFPIVSRAPAFKKFKKSLAEFFSRLLSTAAESEVLLTAPITEESQADVIDNPLINVLKEWLSTFSSSSFRGFRHTSTFIVLTITRSIATIALDKRKSVELARKQRDTEKKKARPDKQRLKTLEERWRDEKEEEATLMDSIRDFLDSVYQHRYRDADPAIRADCTLELGQWIKTVPEVFMKNEYTRYLGWCLSDTTASVRLIAVQALAALYARSAFPDALRHFTELNKTRLTQMATGDIDLSVRIAVIDVLVHIERRGLLEEEQRDEIGMCVFGSEPKVRQEAARFLKGLIEEEVEECKDDTVGPSPVAATAKDASSKERRTKWLSEVEKLRFKLLASRLVSYEEKLNSQAASQAASSLVGGGRVVHAIESLWSFNSSADTPLSDWTALLELILYDHTAQASTSRGGRKGAAAAASSNAGYTGVQPPNEAYRLEPGEENVLLESLVSVVGQVRRIHDTAKQLAPAEQTEEPEEQQRLTVVTQLLIPALPKLFAKYRTESNRVSQVLLLLPTLELDLYATSGQASAMVSLWDEVSTQFTRHSETHLLKRGADALGALYTSAKKHTNLAETVSSKLAGLQETLVNAVREPLKGKEVATSALGEDLIFTLTASLQRLAGLAGVVDCSEPLEDTEGGTASSGWEIAREVALRGHLGYQGEQDMISACLRLLATHLIWRLRTLNGLSSTTPEDERTALADSLLIKRNDVVELMEKYVDSEATTDPGRQIKSSAAARLLNIYLPFHAAQLSSELRARRPAAAEDAEADDDEAMLPGLPRSFDVTVSASVQSGIVSAIVADLEAAIESRQEEKEAEDEEDPIEDDEDAADEALTNGLANNKAKAKPSKANGQSKSDANGKTKSGDVALSQARLEEEIEIGRTFVLLLSAFQLGLVDAGLAAPLIGKLGQVGLMCDLVIKKIIEVVKEEAMLGGEADKASDIILDSLKESFEYFLSEGTAQAEARFVSLSRSLSTALVQRGAQLVISRTIAPSALLNLHLRGAEYIAKKWKAAERANAKSIKARAPTFWKGLGQLLVSARATDAQKIKLAMEQALADADIEVPSTSKAWDPQRQYEKRLVSLMAKKAPVAAKAGPTPRKSTGANGAGGSASRGKQRRRVAGADGEDDIILSEEEDEDQEMRDLGALPVESTPQKRPRARPVGSSSKKGRKGILADDDGNESDLSSLPDGTPARSSSRPRDEDDEEQEEEAAESDDDMRSLPGSRSKRRRFE